MKVDIITHCLDYSRLLAYHLSSFWLNPPTKFRVALHIVCSADDAATCRRIDDFLGREHPRRVSIKPHYTEPDRIRRRSIMRNELALSTKADLVWFSDADIVFGPGSLDALEPLANDTSSRLFYPGVINVSRDQESGDKLIESVPDATPLAEEFNLYRIDPAEFAPDRQRRAIGGSQIVSGATAREFGYCRDIPRYQQPAKEWGKFSDDVAYRRTLGTGGKAVDIPEVYRIRHSVRGYIEQGTKL